MTGAQTGVREMEDSFKNPKAKCPFVPQREMVKKLWGTDADRWRRRENGKSGWPKGEQTIPVPALRL